MALSLKLLHMADVLIIDHHIAGPDLPRAHAVVNPNRLEDDGSLGHLAAGVFRHGRFVASSP